MSSILPVAVVAGVWYHLARQGITTTTIWLGCNLLDTFRALRLIRPSGRAIGQRTRRKAIRDSLICWTSFIAIQQLGGIPDKLLGWLPVYSLVRTLVVAGFLFARVSASETIYTSIIQPTLRKYETPVDLSVELISSIILLVYHFTLEYPLIRLQSIARPRIERLASLFRSVKGPISTPPSTETIVDLTQIDDDEEIVLVKNAAGSTLQSSTPRASRVQQLIQSCEKRSPARSSRDERTRAESIRQPAAPATTQSSNISSTRTQRSTAMSKLPTSAALPSTSREPARPITSRPRVPVKPSNQSLRQTNVRLPAPTIKGKDSILTESRPVPTASEANIARADPPLVKSKSSNHLKPAKPYVTDITATRPVKSAPNRRLPTKPSAGDDPNSPRAKKLAHAAERAREIRERRRRETGVTPGEKRPPPTMSNVDAPGSKRTRISVVRD